jgi:RNA polymerase sigma factor (sigma-70 family)
VTSTIGDRAEDTARADNLPALVGSDGASLSWGELFDEYAPALTYYARSRGVREPEDLVQDVFVAAFKQLPRFAGDRSGLRSLLFTIAYRRIADHHRRCYRRPETLVAEHSPRPDPGPTVEQIIDLRETAGQAMQALAVLSERERRVLEMRILEEDSPATVGRALGLSSGNVRVIQARALAKIRNHLRSMGEGGLPTPLFAFGSLSDCVRYLRSNLPADDLVGRWIEEVRSNSLPASPGATTSASGVLVAPMGITGRAADAAHSLVSAILSSGTARIGAAVSVVALSTAPLLPAVILGGEPASLSDTTAPAAEVRETEPPPPLRFEDDLPIQVYETPADRLPADTPNLVGSAPVEAPQPSRPTPDSDATQGDAPVSADFVDVAEMSTPIVEDVIEPLVEDTVDTLVDDVVEPLIDEVVDVVDHTVGVVEGTAEVVDDTVGTLIDETVQPLVDETVEPLVDDLTGPLDDIVPALGVLLGGG